MKKILFACDLDNTLIHSHKHRKQGDILVETLNGKEQGFMTPKAAELLEKINSRQDMLFVPVTTRSVEQFWRIEFPEKCVPKYALAANGTILLTDGEEEPRWKEISDKKTKPYLEEIERLRDKYSADEDLRIVRTVNGMYLFTACKDGVDAEEKAKKCSEETFLRAELSGYKLYFFTPAANKGEAVKRFSRQFGVSDIIAAGDSIIDIPMLEEADLAIVPDEEMSCKLKNPNKKICGGGDFSEFLLNIVYEYI